jgi:two-component system, repressor protein LuxO
MKGAFTGASSDRPGAFMEADRGTLFLDEIAELDLSVQAKLLRVLQTGEVKRLGDDKTRIVDVRIVCASHRNLAERVRSGAFREDLFYRLFVVSIELPPLRSRGDDVMLIARELLTRYAREDGKQLASFSPEAVAALQAHSWPGNVRELVNVVRAVVAMHDGPVVEVNMLPAALTAKDAAYASITQPAALEETPWFAQPLDSSLPAPLPAATAPAALAPVTQTTLNSYEPARVRPIADIEREAVDYALRAFGGNVSQAARALQMNPSTLYRKIQVWTAQGIAPGQTA